MDVDARQWLQPAEAPAEISRILLHLPESGEAESLIQLAAALARRCRARLRGLTVVDTHALSELVTRESAGYAVSELQRLQIGALRRDEVRALFSRVCLKADLDFDLCRKQGRALPLLAAEAQTHDLAITLGASRGERSGLSASEAAELLVSGNAPWLVMRPQATLGERVLLVQDETAAATRAIRSFVRQRLFPGATVRLLAVAPTPRDAEAQLHESIELVRPHFPACEIGYVAGKVTRVVPEYVRQWEADLVVVGAHRAPPLARFWSGQQVAMVLERTSSALYATA